MMNLVCFDLDDSLRVLEANQRSLGSDGVVIKLGKPHWYLEGFSLIKPRHRGWTSKSCFCFFVGCGTFVHHVSLL